MTRILALTFAAAAFSLVSCESLGMKKEGCDSCCAAPAKEKACCTAAHAKGEKCAVCEADKKGHSH